MSGFNSYQDLGYLPLQDHAHGQDGTPLHARQMMAAGRISKLDDISVAGTADGLVTEYAKDYGLGTLGDVHPWLFWQTRERSVRGMGSYAQTFASLSVDADGYYGTIGAQPIRTWEFKNDTRYRMLDPSWPAGISHVPKGAILTTMPGTEEAEQAELALWADPRIVAPNTNGPGECGTLVVDLQPTHEFCMDGSERPGIGGRHARIQSLMRVVPVEPGSSFAGLGGEGNTLALNFTTSGVDNIPNYGAFFALVEGGSAGPTRPSGPTTGPIRTGGGGGQNTGIPPGTVAGASLAGDRAVGSGAFGGDDAGSSNSEEEGRTVRGFGAFARNFEGELGIGLMANLGGYGPIHAGAKGDKHNHGNDRDGHPINAGHVSTNAYFFQDQDRDAPIAFEGDYPHPASLPIPAKAHLSYDALSTHQFRGGNKEGYWRLWCETPDVTPPEVPPTYPPTGGGDPPKVPGPTTGQPPKVPGGGGGPVPGGGTPGGGSGPGPGGGGGPKKPTGPITPNPGGKRFPGRPGTGPVKPGGPATGGGPAPGGGTPGPTTGGSGGQPSVPCKVPPGTPAIHAGTRTGGNGGPGGTGATRTGGQNPTRTGQGSGPVRPGPAGPIRPGGSGGGPIRPGGNPAGRPGGGGPIRPGGATANTIRSNAALPPSGAALSQLNAIPIGLTGGAGGGGTTQVDPRQDLGRWSGMNVLLNTPHQVPGVNERIGTATREEVALYSIFRPMAQGFAAVQFRPQLTVNGYPNFEHNPQMPAPMYFQDEEVRPQVLTMRAFGAQSSSSGEWAHVENPSLSRARGGTGDGGVIFSPPRFELSDYYGIGADVMDVDDLTSDQATTAYVLASPGVSYALGKPTSTGALQANAVTISQETGTTGEPLVIQHNAVEVLRAANIGTETITAIGGTTGITIPVGTSGERAAAPTAGMLRINTSGGAHVVEFYEANGAAWTSLAAGGGSGATITAGTMAGRGLASGNGVYEEITLGTNLSMSGTTLNAASGSGASIAQGTIAGRGGASGSGVYEEIAAGSGLSFTTTTLAVVDRALTGDVTASGITMATASILARTTASAGAVEEITIGTGLAMAAGVLSATGGAAEWGSITGTLSAQTDLQSELDAKADAGLATASGITIATSRMLGRTTAATGALEEITVGSGLTFSAGTLALDTITASDVSSVASGTILGRSTAGTGAAEGITPGAGFTLSGLALTYAAPSDSITYDMMQDTSGTDVLLGRETASGGTVEEIACTSGARTLLATAVLRGDMVYSNSDGNWDILSGTGAGGRAILTISGAAADVIPYYTSGTAMTTATFNALGRAVVGAGSTEAAQKAIGFAHEEASLFWADFISGSVTANGLTNNNSGSGAGTRQMWEFVTNASNSQGVLELGTGTTATGFCSVNTGNNAIHTSNSAIDFMVRVQMWTISAAADEYTVNAGLANDVTSTGRGASEITFRYDRVAHGANWQCVTRASSTETVTDSGVAVTASATGANMQVLRFVMNEAGTSVDFTIDGADVATNTTNIPNARLGYGIEIEASAYTSSEPRVGIDYMRCALERATAR